MGLIQTIKSKRKTEPMCDNGHKPVYTSAVLCTGVNLKSEKTFRYKCHLCGGITEDALDYEVIEDKKVE